MEPFKLKIHQALAFDLGDRVRLVEKTFATRDFRALIRKDLDALELKDRGRLVGNGLWDGLTGTPARRFAVLTEAVRSIPVLELSGTESGWNMFPMDMILVEHGVKAFDPALEFAYEVTQRFTAEFGVRSLIIDQPKRALKQMFAWTRDESVHVRRLASEGSRPRLPWGQQLKELVSDPAPTRKILEALKDDSEEYVRRSVANHWNDIAKDHPVYVVDVMEEWIQGASPDRKRLVRHACRTLIKDGNTRSLALLGYGAPKLEGLSMGLSPKRLKLGGTLEAMVELQSKAKVAQELLIDYRFHLVRKGGTTNAKVFKGGSLRLKAGEHQVVRHRFPLKPVTTRKYYPGKTRVELLVNGRVLAEGIFVLIIP